MQAAAAISLSPSFSSYSNSNLAEIAARVVEEFAAEDETNRLFDGFYPEEDESEEFEFQSLTKSGSGSSPISAEEIFYEGKIRPVYPIFKGDFLSIGEERKEGGSGTKAIRMPLRELLSEEREAAESSVGSSSDGDALDGVPMETYCVWRPNSPDASPLKSNSTGSTSKRWKLIDLLHRSPSEGSKDGGWRKRETEKKARESPLGSGRLKLPLSPYSSDAAEKWRTYLPYRQDLVGLFSNNNRLY